ncbi:Gfo/Idh/MocA family oxidoreductase [Shewanella gelidimarina]|uniref:Gfo/Idh/MocA family protein n=1 Tax=Shewanella gelidimarina TaxID=56813 RepID=UPI00200DF50C|nr:Gfo/Idh/MocA family oxidoreductase [Shewanella gelidimarina]MCL1057799.1 Gfo/Idh/MocA family oxidoreductase [Shewanella gelidimarina]
MNNIAVIGLGNIALRHRKNLKHLYPEATIIAVSASGRTPNIPVECADFFCNDIDTLLGLAPDLVVIASPASCHLAHAMIFIEANIAVVVEKPLSDSLDGAQLLLDLALQQQSPVHIGYCLRYLSSAIELKKHLGNKIIGEIYHCSASVGQYLPDWRPNKHYSASVSANSQLGGGALLELSHELDYLQWFLGPLTCQYAQLRTSKELALDVEEIADLVLTNTQGTVCNVHLDFLQKQPQRECTFIGSTGRLHWNLISNTLTLYSAAETKILYQAADWDKNKMYINMLNDFTSRIARNDANLDSVKDAHQTLRLISQIKQQATWGKVQ